MYTYNIILRSPDAQGTYQDEPMEVMSNDAIPFNTLMEYMGVPISARYYMIAIQNQRNSVLQRIQFDTQDRSNNREMREMRIEINSQNRLIIIPTDNEEIYREFRRNDTLVEAGENIGAQILIQPTNLSDRLTKILRNIDGSKIIAAKTNANALDNAKVQRFIAHQRQQSVHQRINIFLVSNELPAGISEYIPPTQPHYQNGINIYTIADNNQIEEEIFQQLGAIITQNIQQRAAIINDQSNEQQQMLAERRDEYVARIAEQENQRRNSITRNQPLIADSIAALMGEEESMDTRAANRMIGDIASNPNVIGIAFPSAQALNLETTRQGAMGRDFGRFNIQLQADPRQNINHRLTFLNRTRTVERRPHPHVNNSSCLGNTAEMITSAMNQDEIGIALSYAISYTGNVNPDDAWGRQIRHWPENGSAREIFDTPEIRESGSMTRELIRALQGDSPDPDDDDDDEDRDFDEDHDDD